MGRRYYCEFCDRSFTDVVDSRKKHLKGVFHERARKIYYSRVRDLKTLVQEERQKDICKRFRNTGSCPFEEACTFTHYSPQELAAFEAEIAEQERRKYELPNLPSIQDWLNRRLMITSDKVKEAVSIYETNNPLNKYNYNMLPPSLKHISFSEMDKIQFAEWGR